MARVARKRSSMWCASSSMSLPRARSGGWSMRITHRRWNRSGRKRPLPSRRAGRRASPTRSGHRPAPDRCRPGDELRVPAENAAGSPGFVRQVADLVEQQRAAVRRFDVADLARIRTGKCAALITEQFGLQQMRGMAPQLTATNGPLRRSEWRWIATAVNPLPVPVSPNTNTGVRTREARTVSNSRSIALQVPTMPFFLRFEPFAVAREQALHAVRVADGIGDPLVRRGQRDVIEAIVAQQRPHVRRSSSADVHECDPDDVAHRRAGRRDAADRIGMAAAQVEDAAGDFAGRITQLASPARRRHFPVAPRQLLSQHDGRRLRPVNQRTPPVTTPASALLSRVIGIFITNHHFLHSANRSRALQPAAHGRFPRCVSAALAKIETAHGENPGGRTGCHPASLSSNSKETRGCGSRDVPALTRPAGRRARRQTEHPSACASRRTRRSRPMLNRMAANHKRNGRRTSSVRESTPRFEMVLLPKDNPESAGYAAGRPARPAFGY